MCEYCGCQQIAAIATLTAEHDQIRAVARVVDLAGRDGDYPAVRSAARQLLDLLGPHTAIEEQGLFPAMAGEFGEHVRSLEADHRQIHSVLAGLTSTCSPAVGWQREVATVVQVLFDHILREQDGLFPATLSVLSAQDWDRLDRLIAHA